MREIASGAQRKHLVHQSCNRALELLQFPFTKCMKTFCLPLNRSLWLAYTYRYICMYISYIYIYIYIDEQNKWHQVGIEKNNKKVEENHEETTKHGTKRCLRCFFLLPPVRFPFPQPPSPLSRWTPMPLWELLRGCIAKAKRK